MAYNLEIVNPEKELLKNIKMFLYGKSFIGKTTFASTFPDGVLVISTDGNTTSIKKPFAKVLINPIKYVPTTIPGKFQEVSGWLEFKELVRDLTINEGGKFDEIKTVIVDLVSHMYDFCRDYVLTKEGVNHESEVKGQGKSWTLIQSEFNPVMRELTNLDKNVILIAHEKETESKGIVPSTINSVTLALSSLVTIAGRIHKRPALPGKQGDGVIQLSIATTPKTESGNRFGVTRDIDYPTYDKLIEEIKLTNNIK